MRINTCFYKGYSSFHRLNVDFSKKKFGKNLLQILSYNNAEGCYIRQPLDLEIHDHQGMDVVCEICQIFRDVAVFTPLTTPFLKYFSAKINFSF